MSASLAKQFENCAARCLELARGAKTAGRARFMQMAREYQSAAALIREERSHLSVHYHNGWHPLPPPHDFDGWHQTASSSVQAGEQPALARVWHTTPQPRLRGLIAGRLDRGSNKSFDHQSRS